MHMSSDRRLLILLVMLVKRKIESQTSIWAIRGGYCATVELNSVFDDGKAKPRTAFLTGASLVYAVESLKQMWQLI